MVPLSDFSDKTVRRKAAETQRHMRDHWTFYAFQGALLIVVGVLALAVPLAATLASTIFFGWLMLIAGVVGIVSALRAKGAPGFWSHVLLAALAAVLGVVILFNPVAGAITLTWALAAYFVMVGVACFSIARAVKASTGQHLVLFASGVLNVVLAAILVLGLPGTAVWAIGVYLGISFISSGVGLLAAAIHARKSAGV